MNKTMQQAIEFIKSQIELDKLADAVSKSMYHKQPLHITDNNLHDKIYDLLEEYGEDNDLPEGWWMNETDDIEEIAGWVLESENK